MQRSETRALWAILTAVATALVAVPALATPSTRLTYARGAGAEQCPDEAALRKAVEQRLGYDPFFPWAERTIVVRVAAGGGGVRAVIELLDKSGFLSGARELTAPAGQCGELVSGMALAISIAIDPSSVDRVAHAVDTPPAEDPSVVEWTQARANDAPTPDVAPHPPSAPRTKDVARVRWVPDLGAGVIASTQVVPAVGLGPSIGVTLHRGEWALGFEGRYQVGFDARVGPALLSSTLAEGALFGCWQPSAPFICAQASLGRLAVSGHDVATPRSDASALVTVGARAGADLAIFEPWFVQVHADLALRATRQEVEINGQSVWLAPIVGGFAGLALRRRFP
jgi:hypothetical protein